MTRERMTPSFVSLLSRELHRRLDLQQEVGC